jgi:hypothetical protein
MWLRSILGVFSGRCSRTVGQQKGLVSRVRQCPLLETLEDRAVPSAYMVNTLTDTGAGSGLVGDLRYCVTNATSGNDTISFGVTGTLELESALPTLNASVAIQGPGANQLTVARDSASSTDFDIFTVDGAAAVQISGLTLTGATNSAIVNSGTLTVSESTLSGNRSQGGGAIDNSGSLTVIDSTLSGNTAWGGYGGAIDNGGSVVIRNSTLSGNSAMGTASDAPPPVQIIVTDGMAPPPPPASTATPGVGGAIYGGVVTISNSTIANNTAVGGSASDYWYTYFTDDYPAYPFTIYEDVYYDTGADAAGGALDAAQLSVDHCTIAGNEATGGSGSSYSGLGYGGGIAGSARVYDTILADNGADTGADLYGSMISLGHNLIGSSADGSGYAPTDILDVSPMLGSLQNNGGPTQTVALLAGSPAIDAGDNTSAPASDQRGPGFARIIGGGIDIGAFELQTISPALPKNFAVAGFPSSVTAGAGGTITVTARNADGTTATTYTGTVHFSSTDPQAELPPDYTFTAADNGTHTFSTTLKSAGTQSLTATDVTIPRIAGSESGIAVSPAAAGAFILAAPANVTAGASFSLTLTVQDAYGNVVTGYVGAVHFSSTDPQAGLPPDYTFTTADDGTHTFSTTLKSAGTRSISATDTATRTLSGGVSGIAVSPAAASKFLLTAPASANPGTAFSLTLTVEDAYGNVVTGYVGTVHFSSSDTKAKLPANYTFTAADKGVHTFANAASLRMKGKQTISVTDTQNRALTATDSINVV